MSETIARLQADRERARLLGQPGLLQAYVALSAARLEAGHLSEAESDARVAVQQARVWADASELGLALLQLARALARTERTDRALLHYTEALACLGPLDHPLVDVVRREAALLGAVPGGAR
jgi:tetratricopeptide (TPR) repeat protein